MPKINTTRNSFNSGEVSGLIYSRNDQSKYNSACKTLQNATPLVEGGAKKMPGTFYAGSAKFGTTRKARLVPFQRSTGEAYILEFGHLYIRFWATGDNAGLIMNGSTPVEIVSFYNEADLLDLDVGTQSIDVLYIEHNLYPPMQLNHFSDTSWTLTNLNAAGTVDIAKNSNGIAKPITAITAANPPVVTSNNHGLVTGDMVYINGVAGMVELNYGVFTVTVTGGTAVTEFNPAAAHLLHAYVKVGYFVACDFGLGKYLYIAAKYGVTYGGGFGQNPIPKVEITTSGSNDLLVSATVDGILIELAKTTSAKNSANLIQTAITGMVDTYGYDCPHWTVTENIAYSLSRPVSLVDTTFAMIYNKQRYECLLPCSSSATNTNHFPPAEALYWTQGVPAGSATNQFSLDDTDSTNYIAYESGGYAALVTDQFDTVGDYPSCATFYDQRFNIGGTVNHPNRMKGSVQGDYPNFICDVLEDDYGIQFDLASQKLDTIRWMIGSPNALLLGTAGGLWQMAGSGGNSLTQNNVNASKQIGVGVGTIAPQLVNDTVIWITRSAKTVRLALYDFISNQWGSSDLTRLARHITLGFTEATSGLLQTAFQAEPYPILWCIRADGQLLGMTFERQEQIYGWFRVVTDGIIESVACVSRDNAEDQIWIMVQRTINGTVQRYIEYFSPQEIFKNLSNSFFVHCGLQWNGGAAVEITGISNASSPTVLAAAHGLVDNDTVHIKNVVGMTEVNCDAGMAHLVVNATTDSFQLSGVDSSLWGVYVSGGTVAKVTNEVTGLTYLMGKEVVAIGDGAKIYEGTVATDGITFPYYANLITVGLPYTMIVQPTNPILSNQQASSMGERQKINEISISVYESLGGKYGSSLNDNDLYDIIYGEESIGDTPVLTDREVIPLNFEGDWGYESEIYIVHDEPFPFTLRSFNMKMTVNAS